jgi:uncharacterized protein (TIGR03663 family)
MLQTNQQPERAAPGGGTSLGFTIHFEGVPWEALLYGLILLAAVALRFWDLDGRAYHYDESIHAFDGWRLFFEREYIHSPWAHGPFLYYLTAGGIGIFGDNLIAPRVFPALFGSAIVLLPIFLRPYLGRPGALATAAILAFSPSLLYFSGFVRNDILTVFFDLALVIAVWRYIGSRHTGYLYLAAVLLALSFSTKETAYISLLVIGSFFALWWLRRRVDVWLETRALRATPPMLGGAPTHKPPPRFGILLLMIVVTLPLFSAAAGFVLDELFGITLVLESAPSRQAGVVGTPVGTGSYVVAGLIAGGLFAVSAFIGYKWRFKTWLIAILSFYAIFFLLHTSLLTNMVGLGSGIWQSLGYWIAQQPVERGNQPWYYYFMVLPLYDFLPFFIGVASIVYLAAWRGLRFIFWAMVVALVVSLLAAITYLLGGDKALYLPLVAGLLIVTYLGLGRGNKFDWFLVHWSLMSLLLYIVASEKMPWLVVHMTLPFALLAGRFIGRFLGSVDWPSLWRRPSALALGFSVPLLIVVLLALVTTYSDWNRSDAGNPAFWHFPGAVVFASLFLFGGMFLWVFSGNRRAVQVVTLSLLVVMTVFTLRAGFQANFTNNDDPRELFLYSQISSDVPLVTEQIERVAQESGKGQGLRIVVDNFHAGLAPWRWYLRNFDGVAHVELSAFEQEIDHDVVIVADSNDSIMDDVRDSYTERQRVVFNQWFNPFDVYKGWSGSDFMGDLVSGRSWSHLLRYFTYRDIDTSPSENAFFVYFSKEIT